MVITELAVLPWVSPKQYNALLYTLTGRALRAQTYNISSCYKYMLTGNVSGV